MTAGVLVLNASYEALGVVSVERAVGMVVDGDVDVVDVTDLVLHSPSTAIRVPSILRLQRYVRIPATRRIAPTRRAIFARDGYRCQYCGGACRERRPRHPAQPWRPTRLGERGRRVPCLQRCQERSAAGRGGDAPSTRASCAGRAYWLVAHRWGASARVGAVPSSGLGRLSSGSLAWRRRRWP